MSLRRDLDVLQVNLLLPETEETWNRIANGINGLTNLCHNGACDFPQEFVSAMKELSRPLTSALNSERTRLSGPAIELIAAAAAGLGSDFEPLLPMFFPSLLSLCSRTNKVVLARAKACVLTIIQSTQLPSILHHLLLHAKDKSSTLRLVVAEGTLTCLTCFNPPDLEKEARAKDVESLIRITAKDAAAEVRRASRDIFEAYKLVLPGRVASFTAPLSPTIRKYLDIKLASSRSGAAIHRPQSSLAASTSSSRTIVTAPPERPKSSSSSVKDGVTAVSKSIIRPRRPAISPPVIAATQTIRDEARRVPVSQSQANVDKGRSTRSALVKPSATTGAECQHFASQTSSGPKRILLSDVPNTAKTQLRAGNPSDSSSKSMPSRKPTTALRVVEKEKSKNPSRPQITTQISTKQKNEPKKAPTRSGLSQPTKSQLAKVVAVKVKPAAPAKAPKSRAVSNCTTRPKQIDVCSAAQLPLPPSRSSTPTDAVQLADIVNQPKSLDDKLFTVLISEAETPKKTQEEGMADNALVAKTPITALLASIEQGFQHSPFSPLSPPQSYLDRETGVDVAPFPLRLPKKEGLRTEPHETNVQVN
ncbi:CLASP N terminal domain containing protein [Amanita muscaria]